MPNLSVGDWVSLHSLRNEIATACVKPRNDELKIATGHGPRNDGVYKRHPEELKPFLVIPRSSNPSSSSRGAERRGDLPLRSCSGQRKIATACVKPRNDELKIATGHGPRNDEKMKSVMKPYVYILTNINKTVLYTGVTADLRKRVLEHRNGVGSQFTRRYNLQTVVYAEEHPTMMSAIAREKQIKSWSRRRKEELIGELNPGWQDLMPIDC